MFLIEDGKKRFVHIDKIRTSKLTTCFSFPEKITVELGFFTGFLDFKAIPLKIMTETSNVVKNIKIDDHVITMRLSGKTLDVLAMAYFIASSIDGLLDNYILGDAKMINLIKLNRGFEPDFSALLEYIAEKSMTGTQTVMRIITENLTNEEKRKQMVAFLEKAFRKLYGVNYEDVLGKKLSITNIKPEILEELKNAEL